MDELPGQALRRVRTFFALSQKDVADLMGCSTTFVCEIEHGNKGFPPRHLGKLPLEIRKAVAEALTNLHRQRIAEIEEALK